jgi:hypothetical protein
VLQRSLAGTHSIAGAAAGYGTAFWASAGLTALAIVPCIILVRTERAARRAASSDAGRAPSDTAIGAAAA